MESVEINKTKVQWYNLNLKDYNLNERINMVGRYKFYCQRIIANPLQTFRANRTFNRSEFV